MHVDMLNDDTKDTYVLLHIQMSILVVGNENQMMIDIKR